MAFFRKKEVIIESPANGNIVLLKDVSDDAISHGFLGTGVGIESFDGKIYSPIDGYVTFVFPSKHAIGLKTNEGLEVLVHLGIDTVELEGEGFNVKCQENQRIHPGELMVEMDLDFIRKTHDPTCILLFPQKKSLVLSDDGLKKEYYRYDILGKVQL